MQQIVFDDPYEFIPPLRTNFWPWLFRFYLERYLRKTHGIVSHEIRGLEHLKASLAAGHGILLVPNHCRVSDPMVIGLIDKEADTHLFSMAGWHVFKQDWLQTFLVRRLGAFSVYREGMDRAALNCAIEILETAERPLVVFAEGVVSRTNDRLNVLMDGTAFMARAAARKRAKLDPPGKVVIHPVALRYNFLGDLPTAAEPLLTDIERRLSWHPQRHLTLIERVAKIGNALLVLKEVEYLGEPQTGPVYERLERLIDCLLQPIEREWLNEPQQQGVVARVKRLRMAILPDLISGSLTDAERDRRWKQLADCYLAQQLSCYPRDYVRRTTPQERLLETIERFEEDLTDEVRVVGPMQVVLQIGEAIEVEPERKKGPAGDPLMLELEERLSGMLRSLAREFGKPLVPTKRT